MSSSSISGKSVLSSTVFFENEGGTPVVAAAGKIYYNINELLAEERESEFDACINVLTFSVSQ